MLQASLLVLPASAGTLRTEYDAMGLPSSITDASGQVTRIQRDAINRTASTKTLNGQTISRSYAVAAGSNRIQGFSQTVGGTTTNIAFGYNANGDLSSDGLRTYSYDADGRLSAVTTGATNTSPTTRYAHNVLGQRVFKTEPLYPPSEGDERDPDFFQGLIVFFTKLWGPNTTDAEKQGYAYLYDEEGSLIAETGTGGANSTGSAQYIYLPTANGPMPIAAVVNGELFAVHSDHLNTPRRLTNSQGQPVWQWAYSAFGDEKPTIAKYRFANLEVNPNPGTTSFAEFVFNLRWPGQYHDKESGLFYNYFRSLDPRTGRYTQNDPMGLAAGLGRHTYVGGNPLNNSDAKGLFLPALAIPIIGGTSIGLTDIGIGLGLGAAGYGLDRIFNDALPPRGLPPEGILPPIPEADQCKPGPASRPSERDKGGQSLWDPKGGEWRWFPGDRWHNPHWDHNAHDGRMSPWVNVPHGGLPPVKR
ncbi:hypothetical protein GCM10023165_09510 [Variovorax defluvii]|uniref:RHS repeat-associated core domain-containing protein n=1 Tax=Variovorax defluvii TaxID=913761 RepID=A0ABP8H4C8_9BURK